MTSGALLPASAHPHVAGVQESTAIPFRQDAAVSFSDAGGMLVAALLLLALFYGVAWFAKRAGWLERWVTRQPKVGQAERRILILERQALSRKTTIYRIQDAGVEYLVVESSGAIQLTKTEMKL